MSRAASAPAKPPLGSDYFLPRDFEYAQPLYDLAFLLRVEALAAERQVPEYRARALWRAALRLDGYSTSVAEWLQDKTSDSLDFAPSTRIQARLAEVQATGSLDEIRAIAKPLHAACLRLRGLRGLGAKQIALALAEGDVSSRWLDRAARATGVEKGAIEETWAGNAPQRWQAAHVVPPLVRLLWLLEQKLGQHCKWSLDLSSGFSPIDDPVTIHALLQGVSRLHDCVSTISAADPFFQIERVATDHVVVRHRLGWRIVLDWRSNRGGDPSARSAEQIALALDILLPAGHGGLRGDLHSHTDWSDGATPLPQMVDAAERRGLDYLALTDHSRSSKLQGGLTPAAWVRQAVALSQHRWRARVLHGIEMDILDDGGLDLPASLLSGMGIVIGSVHTSWGRDRLANTNRVLTAIQSGRIDILGHPTSTILGKPGVPTYYRAPAPVEWDLVFDACAEWGVAVEFNCFPSRLDPTEELLSRALDSGCCVAFGSDAHSRAHLQHLRIGERIAQGIASNQVLNTLSLGELRAWVRAARRSRSKARRSPVGPSQQSLFPAPGQVDAAIKVQARLAPPHRVPSGSRIVGLDLTASDGKATGAATLDGLSVGTTSLQTDDEILDLVSSVRPAIVSIDSPLGLPGGGSDPSAAQGIMRIAEYDLASIGIPAYPALIDSMKPLTLRGIRLRRAIESLSCAPQVIESYPGAAQDLLFIPRKQKGLARLRAGLAGLGLTGPGLETRSHDEMDAITAAVVGRFYEAGQCEAMGVPAEAQLIVPTVRPLHFSRPLVICLCGRTGAGKSVTARYLALYYGFHWLRTRDLIRALLLDDLRRPQEARMFKKRVDSHDIRESDLTEFGIVVLEEYHQRPLLQKLKETVGSFQGPVVVDAARDLADVDVLRQGESVLRLWHIDARDQIIEARLAQRRRATAPAKASVRKIDRRTDAIRASADHVLGNDGSLEDLRGRVDDALFSVLRLDQGE